MNEGNVRWFTKHVTKVGNPLFIHNSTVAHFQWMLQWRLLGLYNLKLEWIIKLVTQQKICSLHNKQPQRKWIGVVLKNILELQNLLMYFKNLVVFFNSVYEFACSNIFGCNHKIMIHTHLLTTFLWNNGLANQDVVTKMK